jgi:predicted enzyme related to lactoylglutathione lyase
MADSTRPALIVLRVADIDRSAALYREAFGVDLHDGDNGGQDPWLGGRHAEISWREGAYLHFALFPAGQGGPTSGLEIGFLVDDIGAAHARALAAGAELLHAPRPEPWGATARYCDLDGNTVSLTQPARRGG